MTAASLRPEGSGEPVEASLALYVHMPWCVRKCPYCDFNSHQLKSAAPDSSYVDALIRDFDLELPSVGGRRIDTVFFGGGTPSLFQPEDFSRLLGAFRQRSAEPGYHHTTDPHSWRPGPEDRLRPGTRWR